MKKQPSLPTIALIVAAGRGQRFGGPLPKQYTPLAGKVVLYHTIKSFLNHPKIDGVCCVIHPNDRGLYDDAVQGLELLPPIHGGKMRQDSVRLGLLSLEPFAPQQVLIHDGARPLVSGAIIDDVLAHLKTHKGAIPAIALGDTLVRAKHDMFDECVSRDGLYRVQTPQGFHYRDIVSAHLSFAGQDLTDDTQVFDRAGHGVALTLGDEDNFKITTGRDLSRAEQLMNRNLETRVGSGFDVHGFTAGDQVTLCGVKIPFDQALAGHSDADAALHALTDALLGAIAAGDIGDHFPPSDEQWKGADSSQFVQHAVALIQGKGGRIVNVDLTIICEAPKIGPFRNAMVGRVAEILGINSDQVSVKATTTEQLGFTGRREGIAAQATATVQVPLGH